MCYQTNVACFFVNCTAMPGLNEETEKSRVKSKELSLTQHWLAAAWRNTGDSPYDAAAVARRADSKARGTPAIRMVVAASNSPPPASLSCSSSTYSSSSSGSSAASTFPPSVSVSSSSSSHLPSPSSVAACFKKTGNVPRPTKKGKSLSNAAASKQKKEAVSKEKGKAAVLPKSGKKRDASKKEEKSSVPSHLTVAANPPRLSELAVALKKQGLVEVDNPFVAGHCYFEAVSLSNQLTNFMTSRQGAPLIRSIFSSAYNRDVIQKRVV